jgi:hypothetical protein
MGMGMRRSLGLAVVTLFVMASGGNADTLIPLSDNPGGQSSETSVEQWTRWSFSFDNIADGGNPITDTTGEFQNKKQTYPVYMFGGTAGAVVTRTFTALAGKPFMIPLINSGCLGNEEFGLCEDDRSSYETMDSVNRLFLRIDGNILVDARSAEEVDQLESRFRVDGPVFRDLVLAPNNWAGIPGGVYDEAYNTGFYAFALLDPGEHTIEYGGATPDFSNGLTAKVRVAPIPLPASLPLIAVGFLGLGLVARRRRDVEA